MPKGGRTAFPLLGALPTASGRRPAGCGRRRRNASRGRLASGSGCGAGAGGALLEFSARGCSWLFEGEEYEESHSCGCFTGHIAPLIADMTCQGGRREFSEFSDLTAEQTPDAEDPVTFEPSKLDPTNVNPEHLRSEHELIALRRKPDGLARVSVDEERRLLRFRRVEVEPMADFRGREQDAVAPRHVVGR
jgi:hypothetical protein